MKTTTTRRQGDDPALAWSQGLQVEVGGTGTVAQAGVVLPWLLADRLGLTTGLAQVMARAGFFPLRHRGRALVDTTCALAAGATCLSDVEAMTAQEEIFGPGGGASDAHCYGYSMSSASDSAPTGCPDADWPGPPPRPEPGRGRPSSPGTGSFPRCGSPART